jgi:2-octaprenyl-6-methoxyphenol hydroxylase
VGASAALALGRQGLRVALVERELPQPPSETWDTRIYAISPASRAFLAGEGAWQGIDPSRVQPVYRMDVAGDAAGAIRLDAYDSGVENLATIVESGGVPFALWQALEGQGNVVLYCPAVIEALDMGSPVSRLTLSDGRVLETELVVGAHGAASRIREWAGLSATSKAYAQHGVVANFECERPHRGTAFQWFFDDDILAWLPLPGNRLSMVWSTPMVRSDELIAMDASALADEVQRAGNARLGALRALTPAAAFPLRLLRVQTPVAAGVVLIGDAAHGVHPLAGQGVNLGFGDAEALVAELVKQHRHARCGDVRLLNAYARQRAEPVRRIQAVTHGLHHLFADDRAAWLRNVGMQGIDRLAPLKAALVHEAMS